jgi:membrane associated rhomboid family serine protease
VWPGFVWQFFTYMWVHEQFFHLFFNMLMLFFFGPVIEQRFGTRRFLRFYIICGIGAAVVFEAVHWMQVLVLKSPNVVIPMIGASGATYAVLFAFAYFYPNQQVLLWFVLPIKVRYLIIGIIALSTLATLNPRAGDNIAHLAHLAGIGMAYIMIKWGDWFGRRGPRKVSQREWNDLFGG